MAWEYHAPLQDMRFVMERVLDAPAFWAQCMPFAELDLDTVDAVAASFATLRRDFPQVRVCFFGHVHQPLAARTRIGRTECINVGHFQGRGRPYVIDLE